MEILFFISIVIIFFTIASSIIAYYKGKKTKLEKRTTLNSISKTAAKMGLKSKGIHIYGKYKDKLISIDFLGFDSDNYQNHLKVKITNNKIPCTLSILTRNSFFVTSIRDYKSEDTNFDKLYCIRTDNEEYTTAILSKQLKKEISMVFGKYNIIMENNTITLQIYNINNFEKIINEVITLMDKFSSSDDIKYLLKENIKEKNLKKVRLKNFKYLIKKQHSFDSDFYFSLLSDDEDVEIKVLALTCLKEKGINKLTEILKDEKQFKNILSKDVIIILLDFLKTHLIKDCCNWLIYTLDNSNEEILFMIFDLLKKINNISAVEHLIKLTKTNRKYIIKKKALDTINFLQKNIPESDRGNLAIIETEIGNLSVSESNEEGNLSLE